jgi:hypothetical protein
MAKQHIELLKALNVPEEKITALEAMKDDDLKEWKPDEYVSTITGGLKTILSNDSEFLASIPKDKISPAILKEIEKGQYARFQNELEEVAIKKLGLDPNDLTAEDKKSIKGYVEKVATTYLAKKGNVDGLAKMQSDLLLSQQNLEQLKTDHDKNLQAELQKVNTAKDARILRTVARVEMSSIEGVKLNVAAKFVTDPVLQAITSKYALVLDDSDEIHIKQKDNPTLDVMEKGKKLTFADVAKQTILDYKLGVEEKQADPNDPKNKKTKVIIGGEGGGGEGGDNLIPSYIQDKIKSNTDAK